MQAYFWSGAEFSLGAVSNTLKNVALTKDSATFKFLNKGVQYGDFVAKAALYDHLTTRKRNRLTEVQAMDRIREEFVNYNRVPGRSRDFLERSGLLWFYNYKLRIAKVAAHTLRENPLSALLFFNSAPALGVDTVFHASLPGTMLDGSIWYSVGPGMGIDNIVAHPLELAF